MQANIGMVSSEIGTDYNDKPTSLKIKSDTDRLCTGKELYKTSFPPAALPVDFTLSRFIKIGLVS